MIWASIILQLVMAASYVGYVATGDDKELTIKTPQKRLVAMAAAFMFLMSAIFLFKLALRNWPNL